MVIGNFYITAEAQRKLLVVGATLVANSSNSRLTRISHQAACNTGKALVFLSEARMIENTVCYASIPITLQAGLGLHEIVGCAVRTVNPQ
ncbi:MAG: hypothetical protein WBO93_16305, partial [Gammaproteobacteria bacterium]